MCPAACGDAVRLSQVPADSNHAHQAGNGGGLSPAPWVIGASDEVFQPGLSGTGRPGSSQGRHVAWRRGAGNASMSGTGRLAPAMG